MLPDGLASQSESLKPEIFQNLTLNSGNADVAMVLYFFLLNLQTQHFGPQVESNSRSVCRTKKTTDE